jgi:hypothetical protein
VKVLVASEEVEVLVNSEEAELSLDDKVKVIDIPVGCTFDFDIVLEGANCSVAVVMSVEIETLVVTIVEGLGVGLGVGLGNGV